MLHKLPNPMTMIGHSGEWYLSIIDLPRKKKAITVVAPASGPPVLMDHFKCMTNWALAIIGYHKSMAELVEWMKVPPEELKALEGLSPYKDIKWFFARQDLSTITMMEPKGKVILVTLTEDQNHELGIERFVPVKNLSPEDELAWEMVKGDLTEKHFVAPRSESQYVDEAEGNLDSPASAIPEYIVADSRKRARQQKFDQLPNVLEGLDAFQVLWLAAGNQGFYEREFMGTPMVVDKLRDEAMSMEKRERDEDTTLRLRTTSTSQCSAMAMATVVKGKLIFANHGIYTAMQQRRYAGRAMLKQLGKRPPYFLPDVHVLAPHEFGQVPGFVAGQHRAFKDRLCAVMITYDPSLWDLPLRDRKILITSSKAAKLWVFPSQWLKDLDGDQYHWWDSGWFGTPFDPSLRDFTDPEQASILAAE